MEVVVRGALWLADLQNRAWVPVPDETGKAQKMGRKKATLQHLLDSCLAGEQRRRHQASQRMV